MDKKSYYLVMENRPGEFIPIDINILKGNTKPLNYQSIEDIDKFTLEYTKDELITMIRHNNLVPLKFLNGKLHVMNENKYRYEVFTKDMNFSLDTFLESNIDNKTMMNKFLNIYLKYSKDNISEIKEAINKKDIKEILNIIFKLPYIDVRSVFLYLYHLN